jgi:hypothetical protein
MKLCSYVEIGDGVIYVTGDKEDLIKGYRDNGWIKAAVDPNIPRDVYIKYDTPTNKTIVRKATAADKKYAYDPNPGPAADDVLPTAVLTWAAGDDCVSHDIYFGTTIADVNGTNPPVVSGQGVGNETYDPNGDMDLDTTYYWRVDEYDGNDTYEGDVWSFTVIDGKASNPFPADGGMAVKDGQLLTWDEGFYATTNKVYLSMDIDEVADRDPAALLTTTPDPCVVLGTLEREQTYYWVVDEVGPPNVPGDIWEFTGEAYDASIGNITGYANDEDPANGRPVANLFNKSGMDMENMCHSDSKSDMWTESWGGCRDGLTDYFTLGNTQGVTWVAAELDQVYNIKRMLIWNYNRSEGTTQSNYGMKDVIIDYSVVGGDDPNDWTTLTATQIPKANESSCEPVSLVIDCGGIEAKYVVIASNDAGTVNWWGPSSTYPSGMSEVIFERAVTFATNPSPEDGAVLPEAARATLQLSWDAGLGAVDHDVYFGDDYLEVWAADTNSPEYKGPTGGPASWDASGQTMVLGGEYYWRIDEIDATSYVEKGQVWSFSIIDYAIVDDFESYECTGSGVAPWDVWTDGYWNGTGALVGSKDGQIEWCETTIVNPEFGSTQSLYYKYSNDGTGIFAVGGSEYYSEGDALTSSLVVGSDWNRDGLAAIDIWFHGTAGNAVDPMYLKLLDGSTSQIVNYGGDANDLAQEEWQVWRTALSDFNQLNLNAIAQITIGFGDPTNSTVGGVGEMYFDDIRLYSPRCIPGLAAYGYADLNADCIVDIKDVGVMAAGWLETDYTIYASPPDANLLVAHWEFNGDATDSTGNGHDGTVYGPVYQTGAGPDGSTAMSFDATDDYVEVPDFDYANTDGEFSVSTWFKISDLFDDDFVTLFSHASYASYPSINILIRGRLNPWGGLDSNPYRIKVNFYTPEAQGEMLAANDVNDGEWHIICLTLDKDDGTTFYMDGEAIAARTDVSATGSYDPGGPWYIGKETLNRWYYGVPAVDDGLIDDMRLYSCSLTAEEVIAVGGEAEVYVPIESPGNIYDEEPVNSKAINFKDYAELMSRWLSDTSWPEN